jgi:hypothetical protein
MEHDPSLARTRSIGRMVLWLVLAILAGSVVYTASIAIRNWPAIGV